MKNTTVQITRTALFIALGVVIPLVIHTVGAGRFGRALLPMHIPILLAGFYLEPLYATFAGLVTPFLSSILTGMPPLYPTMYIMVFELAAYALCVCLFFRLFSRYKKLRKSKLHIILALIISMIIGRIISSVGSWILVGNNTLGFGSAMTQISIIFAGLFVTGLFGIIIQLIIIPTLVITTESSLIDLK